MSWRRRTVRGAEVDRRRGGESCVFVLIGIGTMKFRIQVQNSGGEPWWEEYDRCVSDAAVEAGRIIDQFNATLRAGESPRELVSVEVLDADSIRDHAWEKQNGVTVQVGGRSFDVHKCSRCGVTGKRYGLSGHVTLDPKFARAKVYQRCDTSLRHRQKIHRRVPK